MKGFVFACLMALAVMVAAEAWAAPIPVRVMTKDVLERTAVANMGLDIMSVDMRDGSIIVGADERALALLSKAGYRVLPMDVLAFPDGMDGYHDEAEILEVLEELAAQYPDILALFSLGQTEAGRDILALKVSDNPQVQEMDEPAILVAAVYHAREHVTVEVALDFLALLVQSYGRDEYITYLVDNREIYIIPRVNPDGHTYDVDKGLVYWRKNRAGTGHPFCPGVDLNRNFSVGFGGEGSSGRRCSDIYRGPSAFSEEESAALREFLMEQTNLTTAINLHTFGGLILYPWGHSFDPIPKGDLAIHTRLADFMSAITGYVPQPSSDLYLSSGTALDYQYGELGLASLTFELTGGNGDGTFYPPDTILPEVFNIMRPALALAAGIAGDPRMVLSAGLWRLGAVAAGNRVTISWSPIVEGDGGGWIVKRALASDGPFEAISDDLIPFGEEDYFAVDEGLLYETLYWYLVEYQGETRTETFGPVEVLTGESFPDDDGDDDTGDDIDDDADDDFPGNDEESDSSASCGCG